MGSLRVLVVVFFTVFSLHAQKEANFWYFGTSGLDFNSGNPISLGNSQMTTQEGSASISDSFGNLLFYTDGVTVWNKNHAIMLNGEELLGGDSATQSALIVPRPDNSNIYYIFTVGTEGSNGLNYSEVNMTLDGGLGGITNIKNRMLIDDISEKLTAVLHQNGTDVWVVTHDKIDNNFRSFRVTSSGVSTSAITSTAGNAIIFGETFSVGSIKVSPDGSKLAMCTETNAELFDFNASDGTVSNGMILNTYGFNYGAEFSPSGNLLYISVDTRGIYQYDMEATDIPTSEMNVFTPTGAESVWQMQLGPDEKIYVARLSDYLGVVNDPDERGTACNYVHDGLSLGLRESRLGLPDFIARPNAATTFESQNYCAGSPTDFLLSNEPDSVVWDFGDPSSGANNTSTLLEPSHTYNTPGFYTVRVNAVFGADTYTEEKTIQIYEKPDFELIHEGPICKLDALSQVISVQGPIANYSFTWLDANDVVIGNDIEISGLESGTYKVFATATTGCTSDIKEVSIVGSSIEEITRDHIEIIDNSNNNSIRVRFDNINGINYEFQLLDRNFNIVADYQSNANFTNLDAGIYLLNIRDTEGCGNRSFELSLLNFPDFFTPNGDGVNDYWGIGGLERAFYQDASVTIFSRFGKPLGTFTLQDIGWNGTYAGSVLPSNDYWYEVRLTEQDGTVRKIRGHFSLLRR